MRLDQLVVQKGLADSRTQSQKLISDGLVSVNIAGQWQCLTKASTKVDETCELRVAQSAEQTFVSRAGLKLNGALQKTGVRPLDKTALDVGQSTGGFSDCLLQAGAKKVIGVDVGHNQLSSKLKGDTRVISLEGVNARRLSADIFEPYLSPVVFDLVVMDVSFISQTLILPRLVPLIAPEGNLISLIKPQFEVGPSGIGKNGIVRNTALYKQVESNLRAKAEELGLSVIKYFESAIQGGDGNREFFMWAVRSGNKL
ncbi:TlyA family RNA methyltransferase [Agarilytica rhodophyticola]|uniref:TlyA family RNA methyltransferase n=1 Tax=Agarilytica rhodophyticola TaxID=1737490 RepID=UPI000B3498A4|nr:TlyA family RNA methyltransferase [Agarilytica rhodophyticola]